MKQNTFLDSPRVRQFREVVQRLGARCRERRKDAQLSLLSGITSRFRSGPRPDVLQLNCTGYTVAATVKKKASVHPGMLLAEHADLGKGDILSPVFGQVSAVTETTITLTVNPDDTLSPEFKPVDLLASDLEGEALHRAVKTLGVSIPARRVRTLIVNALNAEPGMMWAEPLLTVYADVVGVGIRLLRKMGYAKEVVVALPKGMENPWPDVQAVFITPDYPQNLNPLVVKAVTGKEADVDADAISIHDVWGLGRVAVEKKPLLDTVLTVRASEFSDNVLACDGMLVSELLAHLRIEVRPGDTVFFNGGPMAGEVLTATDRGISKAFRGLYVLRKGTFEPVEGSSPCVSCGACVRACPARLDPAALSRDAEFALQARCEDQHIMVCFECGMCGYVCPARRPVLQYIQMAKRQLAEQERLDKLVKL